MQGRGRGRPDPPPAMQGRGRGRPDGTAGYRSKAAAAATGARAMWFWKSCKDLSDVDPAAWQAYLASESAELEAARERGDAAVNLGKYTVHIAALMQICNKNKSRQRRVIRAVGVRDLTSAEGQQALARTFAGPAPWEQVHIADCRPIGGGEQPPSPPPSPPAAAPQAPMSAASPAGWDAQDESQNLLLVELPPTSEEYKSVAAHLLCSLRATGLTITRIQNRMLHMKYTAETQIMAKWKGADPAERLLWHGTRGNHPKMIYNGQDGFDMRFSPGGLWGQATYFAERAAYSDGYVYQEGPKKMLILAQVLVGDSVKLDPDPQLRLPPEKSDSAADGGKAEVTRYDSVNGVTKGTTVYMVYANGRAYPRYLVQYTTG